MKQKSYLRLIYKIHSKQLRKSNWNLNLPFETAMNECADCIVSISESQALRFIDDINGKSDISSQVNAIKERIGKEKAKPKSRETKMMVRQLYKNLQELQFIKDYVTVIMDRNSDYERANEGFTINGIKFRRFLGTNGGIKTSTIVYVNEKIYPELKRRLDNGRDMDKKLVPAKLEAYQALICSGSTPLPPPKGFIVVNDCITKFKDDVILINDESDGEPIMTYEKDYEVENENSDGYGFMTPKYSRIVCKYLTGEDGTIAGMNTRYAWEKGMIYTFDFVEFARRNAKTYEIIDAWGDKRDVRDADIIFTVSMLKLWDSYDSWEDYYENCQKNGYIFSSPKVTELELENVRNTNYQFLQSYDFTDEEIYELCKPTIDEIKDVLGLDYRKSLTFLLGKSMTDRAAKRIEDNAIKALMIDNRMINDPFVRKNIYTMMQKKMDSAKKGSIKVDANYVMISGDPYALAQSMFGMEITGLLDSGEVYHKYWIDKGADEIVCFRAPMTCHNNIRKLKLRNNKEVRHWYKYMNTVSILNAWDSTCAAMNGSDFDGDTNMCTDNPILLKKTLNSPTIFCLQKSAEKKIPTEEDIIEANKLAFNDDIGVITNHVTSMFEVQSHFPKDSEEYKTLEYRIMCGQHFQQCSIDRAKGIISKPMPDYWYSTYNLKDKDGDSEETKKWKAFNRSVAATRKPYFMKYVYNTLLKKVNQYQKNNDNDVRRKFRKYDIHSVEELKQYEPKTKAMKQFIEYYERGKEAGDGDCVINRMCSLFEEEFGTYVYMSKDVPPFDYEILKCNTEYSKQDYNQILKLYEEYKIELDAYRQRMRLTNDSDGEGEYMMDDFINRFKMKSRQICTNEEELCDIVLDICYQNEHSKQFAWDVSGDVIIKNLLKKNDYIINYPSKEGSEFEFAGDWFTMQQVSLQGGDNA